MEERKGIKESKELLKAVMIIAKVLVERLKDGFQYDDVPLLLSDLGMNTEIRDALAGVKEVPHEMKDLDASEVMQLVMVVMSELPEVFQQLKSK